jgi:hypothetical protein
MAGFVPAIHVLCERIKKDVDARHKAEMSSLTTAGICTAFAAYYFTPSNSTSNISVAFGGMTPPAPRAP